MEVLRRAEEIAEEENRSRHRPRETDAPRVRFQLD